MKSRFHKFVHFTLASSLSLFQSSANAAVDGVEFQPVPVNISNRCGSVILKGTNKYRGYAFKLPNVMLGVDKHYEDLFEILPKGNGQYKLRIGLYFPMLDDLIEVRRERSNMVTRTCNENLILADLNDSENREQERKLVGQNKKNSIFGKKKDEPKSSTDNAGTVFENKVHTLSSLPISQIEVTIENYQNMLKSNGDAVNNILNYQDRDIIFEFDIPTEEAYEQIKADLTGRIGLVLNVKTVFAAKSADGRVEVNMNVKNLADSLEQALGGRIGLANQLVVAEPDLRAFFATAISKMNLSVKTEQGSTDTALKMANEVIARIISANLSAVPMIPGQTWNPNACINNPSLPSCGGGYGFPGSGFPGSTGGIGGTFPDPSGTGNGTLTGPPQPGLGTPGPVLGNKTEQMKDPSYKYFSVGSVLNLLKTQTEQRFVWENLSKTETHTTNTQVVIRGQILDSKYKTLNIVAGKSDSEAVAVPTIIKKDQEIAIKVPSVGKLVTSYQPTRTFLSKDEIRRQGISRHFGILQEAISKNLLKEEISRERGGYVAVYNPNDSQTAWDKLFGSAAGRSSVKYSWGIDELRKMTTMESPVDLALDDDDQVALQQISQLPLSFSFSTIGRGFKIAQLLQDSKYWTSRFEDGQIFLKAKQDLGLMRIKNSEKVPSESKRTAVKYVFELQEPQVVSAGATKSPEEVNQTNWVKLSTSTVAPIERVNRPQLEEKSIEASVYVLMVSVSNADFGTQLLNSTVEQRSNANTASPVVTSSEP